MAEKRKKMTWGVIFLLMTLLITHCENVGTLQPEESLPGDEFQGVLKVSWGVYGILKPDHSLWLWGWNAFGTLGNGTTVSSETPVRVALDYVVDFDLGPCHVAAADSAGDIWYWGFSLLSGCGPMLLEPAKISHVDQVIDVQWGAPEIHVLSKDGSIWKVNVNFCNAEGPGKWIEPELITTIPGATSLTATTALLENGSIQSYYPLDISDGGLPYPIADVVNIKTAPGFKTLIAKKDGTVWNWGEIIQPDTTYEKILNPEQVSGLDDIIAVELSETKGTGGNVALSAGGTVWFWGRYHPVPRPVINGVSMLAIAYYSGPYEHILLKKKDGTYWVLPINYVDFNVENPIPVVWE